MSPSRFPTHPARVAATARMLGAALCLLLAAGLIAGPERVSAAHVHCGDAITTDTTLDADIGPCHGTALRIAADGVTLDLGGHRVSGLTGADGSRGVGIAVSGREDVTVRNGAVDGFAVGILLRDVRHATVHDLGDPNTADDAMERNGIALLLDRTTGAVLRRVHAMSSRIAGIRLRHSDHNLVAETWLNIDGGTGVDLYHSHHNRILRTTMSDHRAGARLHASHHNTLADSFVTWSSPGHGIRLAGAHRNRIARNRISHSGRHGVSLARADANSIEANVLRLNATGIRVAHSRDTALVRNEVETSMGPPPDGAGIVLVGGHGLVAGNEVRGSRATGIDIEGAAHTLLAGNHASENGGSGLALRGARLGAFANHADRNQTGISLHGADASTVSGNVASANTRTGIEVRSGSRNLLRGNAATSNGAGFTIWGYLGQVRHGAIRARTADTTLVRNSATRNELAGFVVGGSPWARGPYGADRTDLRANRAVGNGGDGVQVRLFAFDTVMRDTRAKRNGDDGIDAAAPSTRIFASRAHGNADLGIEASPGVTGAGNRASGNGNPAQCDGLRC